MVDTAWKQILHSLEKSLNPGLFTVWIKPLGGRVDGGKLTLTAPNEFVANWVRDRLLQVIRESAAEVLGGEPRITIKVEARKTVPTKTKPVGRKPEGKEKRAAHLGLPLDHAPKPITAPCWRVFL